MATMQKKEIKNGRRDDAFLGCIVQAVTGEEPFKHLRPSADPFGANMLASSTPSAASAPSKPKRDVNSSEREQRARDERARGGGDGEASAARRDSGRYFGTAASGDANSATRKKYASL